MSITLIIPSERRLHKERHLHRCPIHARGKCHHTDASQACSQCLVQEDNEICMKTLRGTGLEYHDFPCIGCQTQWRGQYGGDLLVDALITQEQADRHKEVVRDKRLDEREEQDEKS